MHSIHSGPRPLSWYNWVVTITCSLALLVMVPLSIKVIFLDPISTRPVDRSKAGTVNLFLAVFWWRYCLPHFRKKLILSYDDSSIKSIDAGSVSTESPIPFSALQRVEFDKDGTFKIFFRETVEAKDEMPRPAVAAFFSLKKRLEYILLFGNPTEAEAFFEKLRAANVPVQAAAISDQNVEKRAAAVILAFGFLIAFVLLMAKFGKG